jgi:type IV pilus assembly protein PilV
MKPLRNGRAPQRGMSLIEILISLVITAIGLLGLAAFAQRARAAALLGDMSNRVANNKLNAAAYASAAVHGAAVQDCNAVAAGPPRELCEWGNLLAGANDVGSGANSAFLGYRGCVTQPNLLEPVFVITVAWGSLTPGIPPADLCAQGVFGDDSQRRILRSQVRVATLAA